MTIHEKLDTLIKIDTKEIIVPLPFSYNFTHNAHSAQVWANLDGTITVGEETKEVSLKTTGYTTSVEKLLIFDSGVKLNAILARSKPGTGDENYSRFIINILDNTEHVLLPTNSVATNTVTIQSSGLIMNTRIGHCFIREQ